MSAKSEQTAKTLPPVVTWGCGTEKRHDSVTHTGLAQRVANLMRRRFAGRREEFSDGGAVFCIPISTLFSDTGPIALGADPPREQDFLGGWVPHAFMATKAIVHPPAPGETPDSRWPHAFSANARPMTLDGYFASTREGALRAGELILAKGAVRLKMAGASGGKDQRVAYDERQLVDFIDSLDGFGPRGDGLVLEENLMAASTYSVGRIALGELSAAYVGTQETTRDNDGQPVYGGSRLFVVRGGYPELIQHVSSEAAAICRLAISFDRLASDELGLVASRRNYDVVTGLDGSGKRRTAVLEQSWRVGGATSAEIAALKAFQFDPERMLVIATSVERYGTRWLPPRSADILYCGEDSAVGQLLKYAIVQDLP